MTDKITHDEVKHIYETKNGNVTDMRTWRKKEILRLAFDLSEKNPAALDKIIEAWKETKR